MSSDVITRVLVFAMKAHELFEKGHLLRAAENYGRGAEAACALGADNLVTLYMQLRQGNALGAYASHAPDPKLGASHRTEFFALIAGAVAALERRRVAGTLMEGKCSAAEAEWSAREFQEQATATMPVLPPVMASIRARMFGCECFFFAAAYTTGILAHAGLFAAQCSSAQFQALAEHVVHAAELVQQPRSHGDVAIKCEADFVKAFRVAVGEAGAYGLDAHLVQLLSGAWHRLQVSGMLETRLIEECNVLLKPKQDACIAALQKSQAAPGLRCCALPGCSAREAHPAHFKSCAACRAVVYCCREHQVAGWPGHKKACKAARKAAAAAEGGAGPSNA